MRNIETQRGAAGLAAVVIIAVLLVAGTLGYQRFVAGQISGVDMVLSALFGTGIDTPAESQLQQQLRVAEGFRLGLFAGDLPNARGLAVTGADDLLLSRPRKGDVLLLYRDDDGDGQSDGTQPLIDGLDLPHGLAMVEEWLYVAETDAIGRIRFDAERRAVSGDYQRLVTGLPGGGNHWARNLKLGPDGWLYFNIGSSCNVCEEKDTRRGSLMRMRLDGSAVETYATGLRNSMGFAWTPWDGRLYAADIARDLLGDDFPPDELNMVEQGEFYGWPYANADAVADPDLGHLAPAKATASKRPVHHFRAHSTPLGMHFLRQPQLNAAFPRAALVTLHGSWNRSVPDGYEVVMLQWQADGSIREQPVLSGFWDGHRISGRPVDIVEDSRGRLYISDDYAGAVYQLTLTAR